MARGVRMSFPRIRIFDDENTPTTHIEIDGRQIEGVRSIDYHAEVGEVPVVDLELVSILDSGIDIDNADLRISFTPKTEAEAMKVLGIAGMYKDKNGKPVFVLKR